MTRSCRFSLVTVLVAVALGAPPARANHGAPVSTFGTNGTSIVDLAGGGEAINDLVATTVPIRRPAPSGFPCTKGSDCTIVIGFRTVLLAAGVDRTLGDAAFAIERFDADGRLDSSFGAGGRVRTPFEAGQASAAGLAVMPDGRFVVAGDIDISGSQGELVAVARYRPDGTLDPTFSGDGKVNAKFPGAEHYTVSAVALQSDGRIVVGGTVVRANGDSAFGLMRFTTDGAVDPTFGTQNGVETTTSLQQFNTAGNHAATLNDIVVDPLDRIVAVGDMAVFGGFRVLAAVRYVARGAAQRQLQQRRHRDAGRARSVRRDRRGGRPPVRRQARARRLGERPAVRRADPVAHDRGAVHRPRRARHDVHEQRLQRRPDSPGRASTRRTRCSTTRSARRSSPAASRGPTPSPRWVTSSRSSATATPASPTRCSTGTGACSRTSRRRPTTSTRSSPRSAARSWRAVSRTTPRDGLEHARPRRLPR